MKYQRLLDPSHAPRDGFPFVDPDTGYTSHGKTLDALFATARLHRQANALSVPPDFDLYIENQVCRMMPGRGVNRDGSEVDITCAHRGEGVIRLEGCATCGGVQAKIRACALHGECTEFSKEVGVKRCGLCLDRQSTVPESER
jgi:hypothetical protein